MDMNLKSLNLTKEEREGYMETLLAVVAADGVFNSDEVIKIYELFALLKIEIEDRRRIVENAIKQAGSESRTDIYKGILGNETLKISLAKDLMFLEKRSEDNRAKKLVKELLDQINLTKDQVDVISRFIAMENEILVALGAGKEWIADENSWKELVSRAAAVGVPLTALNVAGIAGFSAAGITSGLATIGSMSGLALLGLNPMTAGIGALILGGVAVKKIADFVMSSNDSEKRSQLEAFKKARITAKEAIASDLLIVGRPRLCELLRPLRRQRRQVLRASMEQAIQELN